MKEKKVIGEVNATKNPYRSSTCNECEGQGVDGVSIKEIDKIYPFSSIQEGFKLPMPSNDRKNEG